MPEENLVMAEVVSVKDNNATKTVEVKVSKLSSVPNSIAENRARIRALTSAGIPSPFEGDVLALTTPEIRRLATVKSNIPVSDGSTLREVRKITVKVRK